MATKKAPTRKRPAHSGFEAPAIGTPLKRGTEEVDVDGNVWRDGKMIKKATKKRK